MYVTIDDIYIKRKMLLSNNTHLDLLITEVLLQLTIREGSRLFQLYFAANKETIENA